MKCEIQRTNIHPETAKTQTHFVEKTKQHKIQNTLHFNAICLPDKARLDRSPSISQSNGPLTLRLHDQANIELACSAN